MTPQKNTVFCGGNLEVVKSWSANCIDSIVTDPPYGLEFMGKEWDKLNLNVPFSEKETGGLGGYKHHIRFGKDGNAMQQWHYQWAKAMFRITKPGGFLLCFGGTRTYHRLTCAIEDAGWEIRDCMMWLYGCLSEDTEILTKKGWKPLHKTTKYDKIKIYDTTDNIYKWETPQRWNIYRVHKDTAFCLKSDTTDQIVSKEHRCLVEREGGLVFKQAWELSKVERVPVLPQDFYPMDKGFRKLLLLLLQWKSKSQLFNKIFSKWSRKKASGQRTKRSLESSVERRSHLFQKEGKLRQIQNKICQMSRRIFGYGQKGWLCDGTPPIGRTVSKQTSLENRGNSSQRPQSRKQFTGQSSTFQNKQSPQITRVEVSMIQYSGLMFCPTVSTGAFVARRNGKVFITGNSGFPKSHNISKAIEKAKGVKPVGKKPAYGAIASRELIDERGWNNINNALIMPETQTDLAQLWDGYGTALKPAWEPIIVAMKPLDGTFAHNAETHGVAGLNIDGGRIGTETRFNQGAGNKPDGNSLNMSKVGMPEFEGKKCQGRWPANLILDEEAGAMLDEQSGISKSTGGKNPGKLGKRVYGKYSLDKIGQNAGGLGDSGGASRFFYCAKTSRKERNMGMENCEDKLLARSGGAQGAENRGEKEYLQKSIGLNRVAVVKNNHPTVKPLALMKYLCTLLKMPSAEQIILDPFLGSGTTGIACKELGINFIGIEKEREYCEIAVKRIAAVPGQEITLESTLPVTKNVETFRSTKDFAGGSRRPNENLPHISESRQRMINAASAALRRNQK